MLENIDKYCERLSSAPWSEPFNIISNLAYLIACYYLIHFYRRHIHREVSDRGSSANINASLKNNYWDIQALIVLLILIGVGSGLWHIYAKSWSLYLDIVPILVFINLYILSCLYYVLRYSFTVTTMVFLLYHAMNYSLQHIFDKDFLNGSIFYLPTWLFLIAVSLLLKQNHSDTSRQYFWISIVFVLALLFRTIDLQVCVMLPIGSHFIWHIVSAYMMYLLVRLLIIQRCTI